MRCRTVFCSGIRIVDGRHVFPAAAARFYAQQWYQEWAATEKSTHIFSGLSLVEYARSKAVRCPCAVEYV